MEEEPMHERATSSDESGARGGYLLDKHVGKRTYA